MHPVIARFSIAAACALAVTSCMGETSYDVLDDYSGTNADTSVAPTEPADAGSRGTPARGADAAAVAPRPDASAPSSPVAEPAPDAPPPPPKKKKGKHHDDD